MSIEEELRSIVANLLRIGLLRIRVFGWSGQADLCAIEADHLHNLPRLTQEANLKWLRYYYDLSRPSFIKRAVKPEEFEQDWKRLGEILAEVPS
jgi:hypothetical protein